MQIADIFTETANQEKEHGERFFKFLEGGDVEITESFPAGIIGTTLDNLRAAAAGENYEWSDLYPAFAETAKTEGFIPKTIQNAGFQQQEKRTYSRHKSEVLVILT